MIEALNIPLGTPPTRRSQARVVWLSVGFLACTIIGLCLMRLWQTRDTLRGPVAADDIAGRVHISCTAGNIRYLTEHLAGKTIPLSNGPMSIEQALQSCKREAMIYWTLQNEVHIAFDGHQRPQFHLSALRPDYLGTIEAPETKTSLFRRSNGLSIKYKTDQTPVPALAGTDTTLFDAWIAPGAIDVPLLWSQLFTIAGHQELWDLIEKNGVRVHLGQDDQGDVYRLAIPNADLDLELLTDISRSMTNNQDLSTLELTLPDGTLATELRSPLPDNTDITTDKNRTSIKIQRGNTVLIAEKIDNVLYFSNRDIEFDALTRASTGKCQNSPLMITNTLQTLNLFTEIDFGTNAVRFCF